VSDWALVVGRVVRMANERISRESEKMILYRGNNWQSHHHPGLLEQGTQNLFELKRGRSKRLSVTLDPWISPIVRYSTQP